MAIDDVDGNAPAPSANFDCGSFAAGIFDLDGVVTRTARVHAASWKRLFDDYLRQRAECTGEAFEPFNDADYRRYVDGKPRYEGVGSFLRSRGIELDYGTPADPPERETVCGLGNRKNILFQEQLAQTGVEVYDTSVAFLRRLRERGLKTALVSSSKNAAAVLEAAGLTGLFDACVDGIEAARLGLKGKPNPDIFLRACELLEVSAADAFAVEDALSGVEAAHAAGFGRVIGIDRTGERAALLAHGADLVVGDLAELEPVAALPDALESYEEIRQRLRAKRAAVFLDYDGTLTPIVARPELAVLSEEMRATVRELAQVCAVAVVSGRDRADVERLVGLDTLVYAGSHGFDIAGPGGLHMQHERAAEFLPALDRAESRLRKATKSVPGALVERKRYAIAVHYRLVAPDDLPVLEAAVDAALAETTDKLRKTGGKKVFELRPKLTWDKGRAVCWLLEALDLDGPEIVPLYLGDDETDEDAFEALGELHGIGLLVARAPQATAAQYGLEDPAAVARFLRTLITTLKAST
ncbi:trehalose-phosphatase [Pseudomonas sp. S5(2021)]|uniref:trehalose-phosphatase n=1 Tax=Pseudomonas aeruginosa TaxID=287 RepID=UPI0000DCD01F|nr:trehalose-phosphatase [Pseudomonas aeruginosa]ABM42328.1 trehalose 6-phosphatase [Acidovorax sp. JS42]MBZ5757610.1 trehalose-phosphatase [Pseudomonas sp. S5(2021)]HCW96883.1 trehalose-phosphatase [Pseudomonas sp.]MCY4797045.1 trehalose-phosphatase [Pseudomonas aeruginosa]MDZ5161825.1 trehalose-phosphatase [Pseudomonas aeruginosa]